MELAVFPAGAAMAVFSFFIYQCCWVYPIRTMVAWLCIVVVVPAIHNKKSPLTELYIMITYPAALLVLLFATLNSEEIAHSIIKILNLWLSFYGYWETVIGYVVIVLSLAIGWMAANRFAMVMPEFKPRQF